jgi:hypothetical protein
MKRKMNEPKVKMAMGQRLILISPDLPSGAAVAIT